MKSSILTFLIVLLSFSASAARAQTYNMLGFVAGQSGAEVEAHLRQLGFTDDLDCAPVHLEPTDFNQVCTADAPKGSLFTRVEIKFALGKAWSFVFVIPRSSFSPLLSRVQNTLGVPTEQTTSPNGTRAARWGRLGCSNEVTGKTCESVVLIDVPIKDIGNLGLMSFQVLNAQSKEDVDRTDAELRRKHHYPPK